MANTHLNTDLITNDALEILHSELSYIRNMNRSYDSSFGKAGAKIGDSLRIRLPSKYTVRTGATASVSDHVDTQTTLQVASQRGVDVEFTSSEITLKLDQFRDRVLRPAMAQLAASIESDAFSMADDVYNAVDNLTDTIAFADVLNARKKLVDNLMPNGDTPCFIMNTKDNVDLVDTLKGLFHSSEQISNQYEKGVLGIAGGFKFMESTLVPAHTTGTAAASSGYLVNGASQTGATLTVDTGTTTFLAGDIITIAGVNSVHPETKVDTGNLQQFVVTANSGASATSLAISPSITASGAFQNVSGSPADNAAITKIGAANDVYYQSLAFHKDAFTFASADLVMPQGVHQASRKNFDGLSLRFVSDYDVTNDKIISRFDILYGYKTIRPELACRVLSN